jgi:polyhydroxyalkanoate synthesis regulator protein
MPLPSTKKKNKVVDKINKEQAWVRTSDTLLKTANGKKTVATYNAKLEELRATLLATKLKSIFADETRLREEISELYGKLTGQEALPTNLQLERIALLQDKVAKAATSLEDIEKTYGPKARETVEKESKIGKGSVSRSTN